MFKLVHCECCGDELKALATDQNTKYVCAECDDWLSENEDKD